MTEPRKHEDKVWRDLMDYSFHLLLVLKGWSLETWMPPSGAPCEPRVELRLWSLGLGFSTSSSPVRLAVCAHARSSLLVGTFVKEDSSILYPQSLISLSALGLWNPCFWRSCLSSLKFLPVASELLDLGKEIILPLLNLFLGLRSPRNILFTYLGWFWFKLWNILLQCPFPSFLVFINFLIEINNLRDTTYLLVHSPNADKNWDWAKAKASGWTLNPGVPCGCQETNLFSHDCRLPESASRRLLSGTMQALSSRILTCSVGCLIERFTHPFPSMLSS